MPEDVQSEFSSESPQFYIFQEPGSTAKLAHTPTSELLALNNQVPGIFRGRGRVCSYFPQNMAANFLLQDYWDDFLANSGHPKDEILKLLPPLYRNAVSVVPSASAVYFDDDSRQYNPVLGRDKEPVQFKNILYRQGYSVPLGLVLEPPYAGLLVSLPSTIQSRFTGLRPEEITQLCVERVMNDDTLDNATRPAYHVNATSMLPEHVEDFSVVEDLFTRMEGIDKEINKRYEAYVAGLKQSGAPMNAVPYIAKFCTDRGIPYDPETVNYRLL